MRHQLHISTTAHTAILERILRVTRHRGFHVEHIHAAAQSAQEMSIELCVTGSRPIDTLQHQLAKLVDIARVERVQTEPSTLTA